jgi:hypothetical protein
MRYIFTVIICFFCNVVIGQTYEVFSNVYYIDKSEVDTVDGVSCYFLWTDHILRMEIVSDSSTSTSPISSSILEVDGEWGVKFDGRYIIFNKSIEGHFDCYIWYDKMSARNVQVLFLDPNEVVGLMIRI